jgi:hypothetical protein
MMVMVVEEEDKGVVTWWINQQMAEIDVGRLVVLLWVEIVEDYRYKMNFQSY